MSQNKSKTSEKENEAKKEEDLFDPLSLLSSDLLKEINGIDEKNSEEKKEINSNSNNSELNETQKGTEENSNEIEDFSENEKNPEKNRNNKNQKFICNNRNMHMHLNSFNNNSFYNNNCPNRNINMNYKDLANNLNFFNNSFSMNGKQGWICNYCKNFNYEIRIKCNRCGKANDNIFNSQQQHQLNRGHNMRDIGEGMNEIYYCPMMKAKIFLQGNNIDPNLRNKKQQFIERPGDWICYNCQNLNFTFRTNCNRCHMPKIENMKLIHNLKNMMNVNQNH